MSASGTVTSSRPTLTRWPPTDSSSPKATSSPFARRQGTEKMFLKMQIILYVRLSQIEQNVENLRPCVDFLQFEQKMI
jgi:hypothetical protein